MGRTGTGKLEQTVSTPQMGTGAESWRMGSKLKNIILDFDCLTLSVHSAMNMEDFSSGLSSTNLIKNLINISKCWGGLNRVVSGIFQKKVQFIQCFLRYILEKGPFYPVLFKVYFGSPF